MYPKYIDSIRYHIGHQRTYLNKKKLYPFNISTIKKNQQNEIIIKDVYFKSDCNINKIAEVYGLKYPYSSPKYQKRLLTE